MTNRLFWQKSVIFYKYTQKSIEGVEKCQHTLWISKFQKQESFNIYQNRWTMSWHSDHIHIWIKDPKRAGSRLKSYIWSHLKYGDLDWSYSEHCGELMCFCTTIARKSVMKSNGVKLSGGCISGQLLTREESKIENKV